MKGSFEPRYDPDIDSAWRWFEFQTALIREEHEHILRVLTPGSDVDVDTLRSYESQFIGLAELEVEQLFDDQRSRLELLTMFELLATTEAVLRIEFNSRVEKRRKDDLSRRFRAAYRLHGEKVRLDEDILAALREAGVAARIIGAFRTTLRLRRWIAHGRHWHPKLGRGYTPGDVLGVARELIDSIPP
jgi:hypothetical protein